MPDWTPIDRTEQRRSVDGLRRLASLVAEAVTEALSGIRPHDALGHPAARPALALAGVPALVEGAGATGRGGYAHSIDVSATSSTHRPLPHRAPGPSGGAGPGNGAGDGSSPAKDPEHSEIDEIHIETWRLVELAQGGDGEAFGQLYDRYFDLVFRFIYFRVNDRTLAEDFTSETFLRALRRIGTISYQGRDIGAWFVTIARNIVLDHVKSARHRLETTTADTIEGNDHAPSTEAAVLELLTSERLIEAIKQLGDEQRECVVLRFVQGLSVSETAQVMGKNDGAIKALQHRAVRKLADLIGSDLS